MTSHAHESLAQLTELVERAALHLEGNLDDEQIQLYDLAFCRAELMAATALLDRAAPAPGTVLASTAEFFAAEVAAKVRQRLALRPADYGLSFETLAPTQHDLELSGALAATRIAALGEAFLAQGLPEEPLDEAQRIMRDTFNQFADEVVAPLAEAIHREDRLVPDEILDPLREMGCFGLSVPERFGGLKPDDREDSVGMVVVTEELSRGSLGAAGSLITRPEIMARAILEGGTAEQQ